MRPIQPPFIGSPGSSGPTVLVVASASHGHAADEPIPVHGYLLAPNEALHSHAADSPVTVPGVVTLTVPDALHAHLADHVAFAAMLVAADCAIDVPVENRLFSVYPEDRTRDVPIENRTLPVVPCGRPH